MEQNKKITVYKFGGTSLADHLAIRQCCEIIRNAADPLVVVVSAMGGMTDLLLGTAQQAAEGKLESIDAAVETFRERHLKAIQGLEIQTGTAELKRLCNHYAEEFRKICSSVHYLCELTERTTAKVVARGERLMTAIVKTYLEHLDHPTASLDATDLIKVLPSPIGMVPDRKACEEAANIKLRPLFEQNRTVVIPGFIAEGETSDLVLLGRGGTDFSAAIIAASINAESLTLYKEVDGILTADPKAVPQARTVPELHYREATELAYYGAKVLHSCTIIPVSEKNIPVYLRNTFHPDRPGTKVTADLADNGSPVKALTAITDQALVAVEGKGMMGVPGIAGRTFSALARADVSVTMISQASSESSICFVVDGKLASRASDILHSEFHFEIQHSLIDRIKIQAPKAIIALVGMGMNGRRGLAARAFRALSRVGINIDAMAQGSSELNISVVVSRDHINEALQALHNEFRLEKAHSLPDVMGQKISLAVFGFGNIGRTLSQQFLNQKNYLQSELKAETNIVSIADSSGVITQAAGFATKEINRFLEAKSRSQKLCDVDSRLSMEAMAQSLSSNLWTLPFARGIFVDCTAEETAPLIKQALEASMHVVLVNKKPLAIEQSAYEELFDLARRNGLGFRYEATVGAGLPILDTIAKLKGSGDEIKSVYGVLSGTLGYIMSALQEGKKFSEVVRQAHKLGYTEPDPRDDLSGVDVARKALILARTLGRKLNFSDIRLEPLCPCPEDNRSVAEFMEGLEQFDERFAAEATAANAENKVLRYVARIGLDTVTVKVEAVARESALGSLAGTDNQVTLVTKRYNDNPLVVTGPGAGAAVTAAGAFNDIMAIAQSRGDH